MVNIINWRKSSYSADNGGNCIAVAGDVGRVAVMDTKDRTGPVLRFSADAWKAFAAQVKGERSLADLWPIL